MRGQRSSVWLSVWLCATAAFSSFAQTGNQAQPVYIRRFEVAPTIDGKLDEPAWREAAALRDFHQTDPGDNTTPSYPTTIMLGYDKERLYVGVRATDDPKKVRARDYARLFEEEFGAKRTAARAGAFFGPAERSTFWNGYTITVGTSPSRKYSANVAVDGSWKVFDYDFGAGPKFPRVSPAALVDPNAALDPGPGNTNDVTASFAWRPSEAFRTSIDYTKSRLVRIDTRRMAYDQNLWALRASYYFTRFTFDRARVDYDTLASRARGQFLLGWTPHPGTSLYAGYNDDLNYNGYSPFTTRFETGLRRNQRTFFVKMSYLLRRGL